MENFCWTWYRTSILFSSQYTDVPVHASCDAETDVIQGVQQYGDKLVLGLRRNHIDLYIIRKLPLCRFRIHRYLLAGKCWSAFHSGRNLKVQEPNLAGAGSATSPKRQPP